VCVCVHITVQCAQLSYTTQHTTVLTIFPLILQTIIIAQIMSTGGERQDIHGSNIAMPTTHRGNYQHIVQYLANQDTASCIVNENILLHALVIWRVLSWKHVADSRVLYMLNQKHNNNIHSKNYKHSHMRVW